MRSNVCDLLHDILQTLTLAHSLFMFLKPNKRLPFQSYTLANPADLLHIVHNNDHISVHH